MPKIPVVSIVDDDKDFREALECLMQSLGYDAVTFACAQDFLRSGAVRVSSCLISDIEMPGMSGVELHEHLIAAGDRIPTIFVTGVSDEKTRAHALKAGVVGFLTKPFHVDDLCAHLDKAFSCSWPH